MDSGSSGSLQSSSGGDEEYESRTESVQAFFNTTSPHFTLLPNPHPSTLSHHHTPTFFDPSNYLNPFSQFQPTNSLLNLDGVRPRRVEPNSSSNQPMFNHGSLSSSSSMQSIRPARDNGVRSSTRSDQIGGAKNPKKRTRASRRAPTTVLTTDTTNFRAMVQEFTGIPASPFCGSSSYSRRLDLFGSGHLDPLRPSAKRIQPSSPLVHEANNITNINSSISSTSLAVTTNANYQIQPQNMLDMQNQSSVLPFQDFLQPPALDPSLNLPGFGVKSLDDLGIAANLGGLQGSHMTVQGTRLRSDGDGLNGQDQLRSLDGNKYYGNNSSTCKLNYSASSSDFVHHEKGLDNVSSRPEGAVDSWICPAD